jgi:hypothetical protein
MAFAFSQHHVATRILFVLHSGDYVAASRRWLTPAQAFAEARNIVDMFRGEAAKAPIKVHKLRTILEGSGGNIAVLTGVDGKVFIDAGNTASRPRILEAANSLSRDPIGQESRIGISASLRRHYRQFQLKPFH